MRESNQEKKGSDRRERKRDRRERQWSREVKRAKRLSALDPSHNPTALQLNLLRGGGKKNKLSLPPPSVLYVEQDVVSGSGHIC